MISEGASARVNSQPRESLRFPRGLALALHHFKGKKGAVFPVPLQFPSPLPLDAVSRGTCDVSQDRPHAELLWTISSEGNTLRKGFGFLCSTKDKPEQQPPPVPDPPAAPLQQEQAAVTQGTVCAHPDLSGGLCLLSPALGHTRYFESLYFPHTHHPHLTAVSSSQRWHQNWTLGSVSKSPAQTTAALLSLPCWILPNT